jgi:hypothetical protein
MAFGLGDILQTLQQGVQAMNNMRTAITTVFPQITATSTSAPAAAGTVTFTSSQASYFMLVTTSSGFTGKVPIYPQ